MTDSKDYWEIVFEEIRRRPAAIFSMVVLVLLYAVAIYAPLLANDRPFVFEGVDRAAFRQAQREMLIVSRGLSGAVEAGDEAAVTREVRAIENRIETMRRQLAEADEALLDHLAGALADAETGGAERVVAIAERIRAEMNPAAPGERAVERSTVALEPFTSYPILASLGRGDVFFMALWAVVLTLPLWNRIVDRFVLGGERLKIRRSRRAKMLAFVVLPLLAAVLWPGRQNAFFASTIKDGLTNGDVVAERVVFPPLPYGLSETNGTENFRPPTWHVESEIDEAGFYVLGARGGRFDASTGLPKPAKPVIVRYAERGRNDDLRHPLGTDSLGRDLAARLIWGARVSLAVGIVSTVILAVIGTIVGSIAGYYGGWVDVLISRVIEVVQTFPVFFLILIVVAFVGPSILNIMLALGLIRWTGVARLVRGEFIRLRDQDFVVASRALGVRNLRTIFRHVLPNAMGPVLVAATFSVATGILTESALSFLGFGVELPIPSWGSLFIESRSPEHWWIQIYPGVLIFATVMLYNLLGEGVRDALDPRLKAA